MGSTYDHLTEGDKFEIDPDREMVSVRCCDCDLVHDLEVIRHRKSRKVTLKFSRDERATSACRRKS